MTSMLRFNKINISIVHIILEKVVIADNLIKKQFSTFD